MQGQLCTLVLWTWPRQSIASAHLIIAKLKTYPGQAMPGYCQGMCLTYPVARVWHISWQYPGVAWPRHVFGFAVCIRSLSALGISNMVLSWFQVEHYFLDDRYETENENLCTGWMPKFSCSACHRFSAALMRPYRPKQSASTVGSYLGSFVLAHLLSTLLCGCRSCQPWHGASSWPWCFEQSSMSWRFYPCPTSVGHPGWHTFSCSAESYPPPPPPNQGTMWWKKNKNECPVN